MTNGTNGDAAGRVRLIREELLSDSWAILKKTTLEYQRADGALQTLTRETYDRGNGEDIDVLEVGLDEALQMIERGEIVDGKTIILLQYAQLHRIMD